MSLLNLAEKWCPKQCRPILDRISASPIGARIAGGAFWSVFGSGASKAFTLLAIILTARILGKEAFGEFGFIRSTAMTFIAFSGFGVGLTATKYIAELLVTDKDRAGRIIGLSYLFTFISSLLVSTIFYFSVPWLCESRLNSPHLADEMRLGAPLLFLMTMMGTQGGVMAGFQDFRGLAAANFVSSFLSIPLYVAGAYVAGVGGALIGLLCATGLNIGVNSMFIFRNTRKHGVRYAFGEAYKELPVLWKFSLPTLACGLIVGTFLWLVCQVFLLSQLNGKSELGILTAAQSIQVIIMFIPTQLTAVSLPIMSENRGKGRYGQYRKVILTQFVMNLFVTLLIVLPIVLFADRIMILFGPEFVEGASVLRLLCFVAILNSLCGVTGNYFSSSNKKWLDFLGCIVWAITLFYVSNRFRLENGGAFGVAVSLLVAYAIHWAFSMTLMCSCVQFEKRKMK